MSKITDLPIASILGLDDVFLITKDPSGSPADNQITADTIRTLMQMTPAEIKNAYESNADTNAYTDNDKTAVDNIETTATDIATSVAKKMAIIFG